MFWIDKCLDAILWLTMTDYDRQVLKTKHVKKKTTSSVPQVGTQSKQSIPDLKVLSTYEK
jgi:hypothetical protein